MGTRYRIQDGSAFFITTTAYKFIPIFRDEIDYQIGVESLGFCLNKYGVILTAFVFMPNHWHGVLWREGGLDLSEFMRDFKRFTSVQIRKRLVEKGESSPFITGLSSGRKTFTIWKNRFDAVAVYSKEILKTKVDYIHNNPVRKGLAIRPEEWMWSSARFYILEEEVGIPVNWIA